MTLFIYDGACAVCRATVRTLRHRLSRFPEAVPYQDLDLDAYALSREEVDGRVWILTPSRQIAGVGAWSWILRAQPDARLRFAGHLLRTPPFRQLAELAYLGFARIRHRIPVRG
ncbi:thiol-disulfide oxidoreductase DCC family protein [Homoserinibacter sp. YIM 151385]|uniref:thiol-disulfide oxidoreductase DCC family protein n=1 Tax=Homoserinibacter sp. YIM 151385 TaxID=2985506 RepID=UPI0022F05FF5|nr:DCC1-like thiol-disulfide oxidoreductase family protein [Homoserinibacter sp. YIM 151385]WBU38114.1 DCC1-like thiol-disulfide oxidoreductase family protein [Homoserinibacter sp. YIM 151385]